MTAYTTDPRGNAIVTDLARGLRKYVRARPLMVGSRSWKDCSVSAVEIFLQIRFSLLFELVGWPYHPCTHPVSQAVTQNSWDVPVQIRFAVKRSCGTDDHHSSRAKLHSIGLPRVASEEQYCSRNISWTWHVRADSVHFGCTLRLIGPCNQHLARAGVRLPAVRNGTVVNHEQVTGVPARELEVLPRL